MKKSMKSSLSLLLVCCMALSLCACGKERSVSALGAYETDPTVLTHEKGNEALMENYSEYREAEHAAVYVENTSFTGMMADSYGVYYSALKSMLSALDSLFPVGSSTAYILAQQESGAVDWTGQSLDNSFKQQVQNVGTYSAETYADNYLALLFENGATPFREDTLTILVSPFAEPSYDLSALGIGVEKYMSSYKDSAVSLYGFRCNVQNKDVEFFRIGSSAKGNYQLLEYSGDLPCYIMAVGPGASVRKFDNQLRELLAADTELSNAYSSGYYSNAVYNRIVAKPLSFTTVADPLVAKAAGEQYYSYNTGTLSDSGSGYLFGCTSGGMFTRDEYGSEAELTTSKQVSVISTNLNAADAGRLITDFKLYSLSPDGSWVEESKKAKAFFSGYADVLRGNTQAGEPYLAPEDEQYILCAKLNFSSSSPLDRSTIYRAEACIRLDYDNPIPNSESNRGGIDAMSSSDKEFFEAIEGLVTCHGMPNNYKTWEYSLKYAQNEQNAPEDSRPRTQALNKAKEALITTPGLSNLLEKLKGAEHAEFAVGEKLEYIDIIFNLPESNGGR